MVCRFGPVRYIEEGQGQVLHVTLGMISTLRVVPTMKKFCDARLHILLVQPKFPAEAKKCKADGYTGQATAVVAAAGRAPCNN